MGIFDKVLIASDYDGTLKNDDGIIADIDRKAIRYFISEGGMFTVCTGRPCRGFPSYDESIINIPVLVANGAMAYDYKKEEVLFENGIDEKGDEIARKILKEFPTVSVELFHLNNRYGINPSEVSHRHLTGEGLTYTLIEDPSESMHPWTKMMIEAGDKTLEVQRFLENFKDTINFLPTTGNYIEIMDKGVDKGTGLLLLSEKLGVDKADIYAVGDGYNDIEMLVVSSCGFVPCNGSPEALEKADCVVRSNNDGAVANVIEILEEKYRNR